MSRKPAYKMDAVIGPDGAAIGPLTAAERVVLLAALLAAEITEAPLGAALPMEKVAQQLLDAMDAHTARIAAFQAQFRGAAP